MTALLGPSDDNGCGGIHQHVSASGDVVVAGRDININYSGAAAFAVQKFAAPPPAGLAELTQARQQPSVLLTAQRQTIAFTGRDSEMAELRQWRDEPAVCSVWAWHAPGGQGKTRLGQQLGRETADAGWRVGVATHQDAAPGESGAKPLAQPSWWLPAGRRPLLLLVDYAERWPLHDLLKFLGDCRPRARKVRVLLLARSVDWWPTVAAELDKRGFTAGGGGQPYLLTALAHDVPGRSRLFEAACRRFAQIYQPDIPAQGWPGQWHPPGDLGDDSVYGITLGIHMAALATVDAHTRQMTPPASAGDVSRYLLDRERSYWSRLHGSAPDTVRAAARTVLLACLTGPQPRDDGIRLLELIGLASRSDGEKLLDAHDRCYPPTSTSTVLEPVYPDRLAEDFIALSLPVSPAGERITPSGHTDSWSATTLITTHRNPDGTVVIGPGPLTARTDGQPPAGHTSRILIFLAAAASRNQHVKGWLDTMLSADPALAVYAGGVALSAVVPYTSPTLAETINRLLPERSLDLDPAAAILAQHLLDHSDDSPEQRARRSGELASRLAHVGRWEQALASAEESASLYRQLAEVNSDAYLPDLAMALNGLGATLSDLGRRKQALGPIEEAVGIYQGLAEVNPDAYLPGLAMALTNLGASLANLGRLEHALGPSEDAVAIYQGLAEVNPDAYLPDLAKALNNLGVRVVELGRLEQALDLAGDVVDIYQGLAEVNPDAYLPHLAMALNNLGANLMELGRPEQALGPTDLAVNIWRLLAEANPDAYLPDLAMALTNLGTSLSTLDRLGQALGPAKESASIYHGLAEANPDAYLPNLAASLTNLSLLLPELNCLEQALGLAEGAVAICRQLADANPDAHLPDLAASLRAYALVCEGEFEPSSQHWCSG
ncbi:tetratricopeptide repeat protein [Actinoplanes sp. NPDC023801]|uniref:tetratricopeptide repeat protein n=1 Tax=Actinoplanes sp. NPDC023801 TaxID=3154595 RepID=UPI00340690B5